MPRSCGAEILRPHREPLQSVHSKRLLQQYRMWAQRQCGRKEKEKEEVPGRKRKKLPQKVLQWPRRESWLESHASTAG